MIELRSRPLMRLHIDLHPMQQIGETPYGRRVVVPVSGGHFAGERLRGTVLPVAGMDWLLSRADGAFQQDVRLTLATDDGALILMSYRGVRTAPPEVAARLARGETVGRDEYYLRTAPFFETGDARYAWMNTIVAVGMGERMPNGAAYDVFEVL
jgi:hypothetical protein